MEKIRWKSISSELVDILLEFETEEQVIQRLLGLMYVKQLKNCGWFDSDIVDMVFENMKKGISAFD